VTTVVFTNEVCSAFTVMSSQTLLSDHVLLKEFLTLKNMLYWITISCKKFNINDCTSEIHASANEIKQSMISAQWRASCARGH